MKQMPLAIILLALLLCTGCTKQETTENLRNVKDGLHNTWNHVKSDVSEATEEFKEETR
jgi:PBP1b-binding outer membrane lipoprotein LpoB